MRVLLAALGLLGCETWEGPYVPFRGPFQQADSGLPIFPQARLACPRGGDEYCSRCCEHFLCYRPAPDTECDQPPKPTDEFRTAGPLIELEYFYGNWLCESRGPFDPVAAGEPAGDCCYVISNQSCI